MKSVIKTISIGYEIPSEFDLYNEHAAQFSENVRSKYLEFYEVLKNELILVELPNSNYLVLFSAILMFTQSSLPKDSINFICNKLNSEIATELKDFLDSNGVHNRLIEQEL